MTKKKPECDNCRFPTKEVQTSGDRRLCRICARSMPGIYSVGGSAAHSVPAVVMRQISFCTNLILSEIEKIHGVEEIRKEIYARNVAPKRRSNT